MSYLFFAKFSLDIKNNKLGVQQTTPHANAGTTSIGGNCTADTRCINASSDNGNCSSVSASDGSASNGPVRLVTGLRSLVRSAEEVCCCDSRCVLASCCDPLRIRRLSSDFRRSIAAVLPPAFSFLRKAISPVHHDTPYPYPYPYRFPGYSFHR